MVPSESIYNLILGYQGRMAVKLTVEVTRVIYVGVDLNFRAQTAFL